MKDKILDKLKANRTAESKDVTDLTLESQAALLSNFILDDEGLGKLDAVAAIKSMQGNINFTAAAAAKAEREKLNQKTPEQIAAEKLISDKAEADKAEADRIEAEKLKGGAPLDMAAIAKLITDGIAQGLAPINAEKQKAEVMTGVKAAILEKFQFDESDKAMSDYILGQVALGEVKDVDSVVQNYEAKYNEYRTINGQDAIAPKVVVSNPDASVVDAWEAQIVEKRKQEAAKIDAANKKFNQ